MFLNINLTKDNKRLNEYLNSRRKEVFKQWTQRYVRIYKSSAYSKVSFDSFSPKCQDVTTLFAEVPARKRINNNLKDSSDINFDHYENYDQQPPKKKQKMSKN